MTRSGLKAKEIAIRIKPLSLTTAHPFGISYGTSSTSENILVELCYEDKVGLGECSPTSYHDETLATANAVLTAWGDQGILGDDPFQIESIMKRLDKSVSGNRSCKAAIDMALHDLVGKILNVSVKDFLGLKGLPTPITDFTIGIDSLSTVEKKVREAIDAGYKHLKVKQGTDNDRQIIETVREVCSDIPLRVDANGAWTVKKAIEMSEFLHGHGVEFIEQPLPKYAPLSDWHIVRQNASIPVYADESVSTAVDVARMAGYVDGIVVKLAKTGGLSEARRVINTARAHSMKVMFGCMIESSLGVTAAFHLASLVDHLDLDGHLLLADDPYIGATYDDGYLKLDESLSGLCVMPRGHK